MWTVRNCSCECICAQVLGVRVERSGQLSSLQRVGCNQHYSTICRLARAGVGVQRDVHQRGADVGRSNGHWRRVSAGVGVPGIVITFAPLAACQHCLLAA